MQLPDLTHNEHLNEVFVDATPDGGYALRILQAFRRKCDCAWEVSGVPEESRRIYELMNAAQLARAAELDRAIRRLQE